MSFRKPCHMPFRKLIPLFTLPQAKKLNLFKQFGKNANNSIQTGKYGFFLNTSFNCAESKSLGKIDATTPLSKHAKYSLYKYKRF